MLIEGTGDQAPEHVAFVRERGDIDVQLQSSRFVDLMPLQDYSLQSRYLGGSRRERFHPNLTRGLIFSACSYFPCLENSQRLFLNLFWVVVFSLINKNQSYKTCRTMCVHFILPSISSLHSIAPRQSVSASSCFSKCMRSKPS